MADHVKPTQEELAESIRQTEAALQQEESTDTTQADETTETPAETASTEETEVVEKTGEAASDETEEVTPEEEKPTTEERYKESSQEARKLAEDQRKINDAFHAAHNLPEPTDDELKREFPDFDLMSDTEKRLATKTFMSDRRFDVLEQAAAERRVVDEWNDKVIDYIDNPKTLIHHTDLEGKRDEFVQYATDKTRRNVNLSLVVSAFLHDHESTKVHHTGKMLETGQGGDKQKITPKDDLISVEESQQLMQTDYKKYRQLLAAGKIKSV